MAEFEDDDSKINIPVTKDTPLGSKLICVKIRRGAENHLFIGKVYTLLRVSYLDELCVEVSENIFGQWYADQFEIL